MRTTYLRAILLAGCAVSDSGSAAAADIVHAFNIPPQSAAAALNAFAAQSGRQIVFPYDAAAAVASAGVRGRFSDADALRAILRGTRLQVVSMDKNGIVVREQRLQIPVSHAARSATPAAPAEAPPLEDIVVTAAKRLQRLQDAPASIVAERGKDLQHRGATQLQDVIDNTPGLNNPSPGPANEANITIRGVTTGTSSGLKQSTVALLYDDIPIDPGAGGGAGAGATNLRVVDIERVEVLRGPQGTLFGSGSLAGAVRFVTNKPDLSRFSAAGEITVSGTETGGASYNGALTLNAPLIEDKLAIRAVGYRFHDGGWIDDQHTGQKDINGTDTLGARIILAAAPTDRIYTSLSLFYQNSKDHSTGDSYFSKPANTLGSGQVSDGQFEPEYEGMSAIASLYVQYNFESASLISSTTYHRRNSIQSGTDYEFLPLITAIASELTNSVNGPDSFLYFVNSKTFTQELRLTSRGAGPLKWTIGGFFLDSDNAVSQQNDAVGAVPYIGGPNLVDEKGDGTQTELAGFGEATYTLFGRLDLTAGMRVSTTRLTDTVVTGGYLPVFSESASDYVTKNFNERDTPINPHVSVAFRATTDFTIYGAAARGFRVGGVNETSGVGGRDTPGSYGPDSLWTYEAGAKGRLLAGRMTYSADAYYIDWSDIQVSLQNNQGNYTANAGEARLHGLEAQSDFKPTPWLALGASFSVSNNRISKGVDGLVTATGVVNVKPGDRLPASPQSQAAAYGEFDFRTFGGHAAYVRLSGNYIGAEYTSFARAGSKFGDYAAADLRAGVNLDGVEVVGFINNLADSQGKQSAEDQTKVGPVVLLNQYAYRIRPRTFGVTLRAGF